MGFALCQKPSSYWDPLWLWKPPYLQLTCHVLPVPRAMVIAGCIFGAESSQKRQEPQPSLPKNVTRSCRHGGEPTFLRFFTTTSWEYHWIYKGIYKHIWWSCFKHNDMTKLFFGGNVWESVVGGSLWYCWYWVAMRMVEHFFSIKWDIGETISVFLCLREYLSVQLGWV